MADRIIAGTIRMMKSEIIEDKEVKVLKDVEVTIEEAYKFVSNYVYKAFRRGYYKIRRKNGTYITMTIPRNKSWDIIPDIVQFIMTGNGGDFIDVGHNGDKWETVLPMKKAHSTTPGSEQEVNTYAVRKGWVELQGKCSIARMLKAALSRSNAAKGYWSSKYFKLGDNGYWTKMAKKEYDRDNPNHIEMKYHPRTMDDVAFDSKEEDFKAHNLEWMRTYIRDLPAREKSIMLMHLKGYNNGQIAESCGVTHQAIAKTITKVISEMRTEALS